MLWRCTSNIGALRYNAVVRARASDVAGGVAPRMARGVRCPGQHTSTVFHFRKNAVFEFEDK
jgi:hypothetical protein